MHLSPMGWMARKRQSRDLCQGRAVKPTLYGCAEGLHAEERGIEQIQGESTSSPSVGRAPGTPSQPVSLTVHSVAGY